jgi:hypothetical protein
VALRYNLPVEMSEQVRRHIQGYKERQMEKRKREREERLGLHAPEEAVVEEEMPAAKKKRKSVKKEGVSAADEAAEARRAEEERRKKRPLKVPTEGESVTD